MSPSDVRDAIDAFARAAAKAKHAGFTGVQVAIESPHLSFEALTDAEIDAIAALPAQIEIQYPQATRKPAKSPKPYRV